jgi:hypothetical protein
MKALAEIFNAEDKEDAWQAAPGVRRRRGAKWPQGHREVHFGRSPLCVVDRDFQSRSSLLGALRSTALPN